MGSKLNLNELIRAGFLKKNKKLLLKAGVAMQDSFFLNFNAFTSLGDSRIADRYVANTRYIKRGLGHNWWHHANSLLGGRMFDAGSFAYSGQTCEQYLGYSAAPLHALTIARGFASNVEAAFATNAGWLEIWGIINDIAVNTDANALVKDYWTQFIKPVVLRWIARGGKVIIHSETGAVNFSGKPNFLAAMHRYNQQAKEFCMMSGGNAIYHDVYAVVVDPTLTGTNHGFLPGMSSDGVHFNTNLGGHTIGKSFAALMENLVPKISLLPLSPNIYSANSPNRFPNPLFTTQTGGAASPDITSGTLPQGFDTWLSRTPDGGTNAAGVVKMAVVNEASPNGRGRQLNCTFTATAAGSAQFLHTATLVPGKKYYAVVEIDAVSGNLDSATSVLGGVELVVTSTVDGTSYPNSQGFIYAATDGPWPELYKKYVIVTPIAEIPMGTVTASSIRLTVFVLGAGRPQIIIRQFDYYQVTNQ